MLVALEGMWRSLPVDEGLPSETGGSFDSWTESERAQGEWGRWDEF